MYHYAACNLTELIQTSAALPQPVNKASGHSAAADREAAQAQIQVMAMALAMALSNDRINMPTRERNAKCGRDRTDHNNGHRHNGGVGLDCEPITSSIQSQLPFHLPSCSLLQSQTHFANSVMPSAGLLRVANGLTLMAWAR